MPPEPSQPAPRRRLDAATVGGIIAAVVAVVGLVVVLSFALRTGGRPEAGMPGVTQHGGASFAKAAPLPPRAVSPAPGAAGGADAAWVTRASVVTGIPERALAAYAGAALFKSLDRPECGLGWNTIAAIGLIESDHGRHGGASVAPDGTVSPPIFGVALDGVGTASIPDSDGGAIDGDAKHDRAVGPMQLIPDTWRNWHVDGNGDGVEDPHNVDDASIAAANYLCRSSPDMTDEPGWRAGVLAYNASEQYASDIADAANGYAASVASIPELN